MQFSYITNSNNIPMRNMELDSLADLIKYGFTQSDCEKIRSLTGNEKEYQKHELTIPRITPQCLLKDANFGTEDDFNRNFIDFSGFLFLDLTFPPEVDVIKYKEEFIEEFKDIVTLVSFSHSMKGIFVLVKINKRFSSKDDFNNTRDMVINHYFPRQEQYIHPQSNLLNGIMVIPFDPNVYINEEAVLNLPPTLSNPLGSVPPQYLETPLSALIGIASGQNRSEGFYEHRPLQDIENIEAVLSEEDDTWKDGEFQLRLKSEIPVHGQFFDFRRENFVELRLPRSLGNSNDAKTQNLFSKYIKILLFLNPCYPVEVFSFIRRFNEKKVYPKMRFSRLKEVFCATYREMLIGKMELNNISKGKNIHFNKDAELEKGEKIAIANKTNGANRGANTCQKIKTCIEFMTQNNDHISVRSVAKRCGVSKNSVSKYMANPCPELKAVIDKLNEELEHKRKNDENSPIIL